MKTKTVGEFIIKYDIVKNMIYENESWQISLRPEQKTTFSLILSIKTSIFRFNELNERQFLDLHECYNIIENIAYTKLKAHKVNYLCLMMLDDIIHFHVFFRYNTNQTFHDLKLEDIYFPKPIDITDNYNLNFENIKSKLFLLKHPN